VQPVRVLEHPADPGDEPAFAALRGQPEAAADPAQLLQVERPGLQVGGERVAQAVRGGPHAGDRVGEMDAPVRPGPGERVVVHLLQPRLHRAPADAEEAGELVLGGAVPDHQAGLQQLQRRQRQAPHHLEHRAGVGQALGEGLEPPRPRGGDGVGAVRENSGQPVFVEGRQPAEQVIVHHRSLTRLPGPTRKPP